MSNSPRAPRGLTPIATAERKLGLPRGWLRIQAAADRIPHVRADKQMYVHVPTVARLLMNRAKGLPSYQQAAHELEAEGKLPKGGGQ